MLFFVALDFFMPTAATAALTTITPEPSIGAVEWAEAGASPRQVCFFGCPFLQTCWAPDCCRAATVHGPGLGDWRATGT